MSQLSNVGMSQLSHAHEAGDVAHLIQWAGYITFTTLPHSTWGIWSCHATSWRHPLIFLIIYSDDESVSLCVKTALQTQFNLSRTACVFHKLGKRQKDKRIILETISISHYVEKVCHVKIILEATSNFVTKNHPGNLFNLSLFWLNFAANPKYRFVGRWTTWTSRMRRKRTLGFLAS